MENLESNRNSEQKSRVEITIDELRGKLSFMKREYEAGRRSGFGYNADLARIDIDKLGNSELEAWNRYLNITTQEEYDAFIEFFDENREGFDDGFAAYLANVVVLKIMEFYK